MQIDRLAREINEKAPHLGAETEGTTIDRQTLEVVHLINGEQPTEAVRRWLQSNLAKTDPRLADSITPDIPETTVEANPAPLRTPLATAASQRLMAIIVDQALQDLSGGDVQLLNGATWRPSKTTQADASSHIPAWKQTYYRYQIDQHGDKVADATGDHFNLSLPWMDTGDSHDYSRRMIEMTARMRLIAGAISIALSASSPLHYFANGSKADPTFGTSLTQYESARLGQVWPGRTLMDLPDLNKDPVSFRRTMERFASTGILKSGRDIWLPVRAQPGSTAKGQSFEELCSEIGIDMSTDEGRAEADKLLTASFEFGPNDSQNSYASQNPHATDPRWQKIETWRRKMLQNLIDAPRNRVEVRTLETPPAFNDVTPYEYIKAVHTFLDLLFIYLSTNPEFVQNLEYDSFTLQAAKDAEQKVLLGGIDAEVRWVPDMTMTTPRKILEFLLKKIEDLANGLGREEDLEVIRQVVSGGLKTPAARIREEVGAWYGINVDNRHNPRLLANDEYPKDLLNRNRTRMADEVAQISADLPKMPPQDQQVIAKLLADYYVLDARKSTTP